MGSTRARWAAVLAVAGLCGAASARADTVTPLSGGAVRAIACPSSSDCLAVEAARNAAGGRLVPISHGVPGSATTLPGAFVPGGIACLSASSCIVAGTLYSGGSETATTQGAVLAVTSGTPGAAQPVPGTTELRAIACPTSGSCVAAGRSAAGSAQPTTGVIVPLGGGGAGAAQAVSGTFLLDGIACADAATCVAVGTSGVSNAAGVVVPVTSGVAGGAQRVAGTSDLIGVGCATGTGRCLAAGAQTIGSSSDGVLVPVSDGTAGSSEPVQASNSLWDVSCPSSSACVASGVGGIETGVPVAGGGIGSWYPVAGRSTYLNAIHCASESACVAGGQEQNGSGVVVDIASRPPATPAAAVNQALTVSGAAAKIPAILAAGGYPASAGAPSAGTLKIAWYSVPPGAHLARVVRPVLVAQGVKRFATAGTTTLKLRLTAAGRKLLAHSHRAKLTAVGSFVPKHGRAATKRRAITLSSR